MRVTPRLRRGMDACSRQSFRVGSEGHAVGMAWYTCPKCRIVDASPANGSWRFEVYDDSDPSRLVRYVSGYRRSKSSALRAVRREFARRAA